MAGMRNLSFNNQALLAYKGTQGGLFQRAQLCNTAITRETGRDHLGANVGRRSGHYMLEQEV